MLPNFAVLLFISLVSTTTSLCRAQLTGLPQPTLHPIISDSISQPAAVGTDTEPGSDPAPPTQQIPVPSSTNEPASEESSQVEPYVSETLSDTSATSTGGDVTTGTGTSRGSLGDKGTTVSTSGGGISIGAVVGIIVALMTVIAVCVALLVIRRRRQQRTRRAAAGMRQLKLGGSHAAVTISKPMPVQLGVGYSQHYRAQSYDPDNDSYRHSRGSSYDSHEASLGGRSDMYSTIRPGMAGIGAHASIHSSQDTTQSRWSP